MVDRDKLKAERNKLIKQMLPTGRLIVMDYISGNVSFQCMIDSLGSLFQQIKPLSSFKSGGKSLITGGGEEFIRGVITPTKDLTSVIVSAKTTEEIVKGLKSSDFEVIVPAREVAPWECNTDYFVGHNCTYEGLEYKLMGSMLNDYFNPMSINEQPDISGRWKLKE